MFLRCLNIDVARHRYANCCWQVHRQHPPIVHRSNVGCIDFQRCYWLTRRRDGRKGNLKPRPAIRLWTYEGRALTHGQEKDRQRRSSAQASHVSSPRYQ